MNFESIIDDAIKNNKALCGSFSGPINKDGSKVKIKTIVMKGEAHLQIEKFIDKKAFHENIAMDEAKAKLVALMSEYKQLFITIDDDSYQVFNNKGKIKAISTKTEKSAKALSHDNKKNYIINEGDRVDFLIYLKVMSEDGKVYNKYFDKFKQIKSTLKFLTRRLTRLILRKGYAY